MDYSSVNVSCMKKITLNPEMSEKDLTFLVKVIDKRNYSEVFEVKISCTIKIPEDVERYSPPGLQTQNTCPFASGLRPALYPLTAAHPMAGGFNG